MSRNQNQSAVEFRQHPRHKNIVCSSDGRIFFERKPWRRGGESGKVYLAVDWGWRRKGHRVIEYVHRLVAETFGHDIAGVDLDHKDRDPKHNAECNLRPRTVRANRGHYGNDDPESESSEFLD